MDESGASTFIGARASRGGPGGMRHAGLAPFPAREVAVAAVGIEPPALVADR